MFSLFPSNQPVLIFYNSSTWNISSQNLRQNYFIAEISTPEQLSCTQALVNPICISYKVFLNSNMIKALAH
jgi:hypothetical protein